MARGSETGPSVPKKLLFSLGVICVFYLLVEAILYVLGTPVRTAQEDPYLGFEGSRLPVFVRESGNADWFVTAPNKRRWFNVQRFRVVKPAENRRIFCLGGSTTYGRPFDDGTSFCGWLRRFLSLVEPEAKFEVVNAGGISYASYRVARLMDEIAHYEPDLVVLYTGHNEFLEERTYRELRDSPRWIRSADEVLSGARTYSLLHRAASRLRGFTESGGLRDDVVTVLDSSIGPDAYKRDDAKRAAILEHFRFNLSRVADQTRRSDAQLLAVVPASNLRSCSPFKSEASKNVSSGELNADDEMAISELEKALEIDPRRADWLYQLGERRLRAGDESSAEAAFVGARDEDVCPLRAPSEFVEAVREFAEAPSVWSVDFPRLLRRDRHQIPGEESFLDHVHPNPETHAILGAEIVETLVQKGWVSANTNWDRGLALELAEKEIASIDLSEHGRSLRNLAKVLAWAGKDDEAERAALRSLEIDATDAESLYILGTIAQNRGRDEDAMRYYERVLVEDEEFVSARHNLGVVLARRGLWAEAEETYRKVLAVAPRHPHASFNLARVLVQQGRLVEAEDEYRRVVDRDPRDTDAWFNLGRLFAQQSRNDEARDAFRRALKLDPGAADAKRELELLGAN